MTCFRGGSNLANDRPLELLKGVLADELEDRVYPEGCETPEVRPRPQRRCEHGEWITDVFECQECMRGRRYGVGREYR